MFLIGIHLVVNLDLDSEIQLGKSHRKASFLLDSMFLMDIVVEDLKD